jgi:RNA polymerase sigma-70 factor (ECF subfamily)
MEELPLADIEAAVRGDPEASRRIVEVLHRPILATIHRFLGTSRSHEAEDVAQEVFLKVFRSLGTFEPERRVRFTTWVYTFVKNHCFDLLKKRHLPTVSVDGPATDQGEGRWELPDPDGRKPGDSLLDEELRQLIDAALQQLSPDHRMVFILREFEQMDLKAIADVMDCNEGTVKSRLHRAKEALKDRLRPYLQP